MLHFNNLLSPSLKPLPLIFYSHVPHLLGSLHSLQSIDSCNSRKMVRLRSNFSTTTPIRTTGSQRRSLSETDPRAASTLSGPLGASPSEAKDEAVTGRMRQLSLTSSDEVNRGGSIPHFEVMQSL